VKPAKKGPSNDNKDTSFGLDEMARLVAVGIYIIWLVGGILRGNAGFWEGKIGAFLGGG